MLDKPESLRAESSAKMGVPETAPTLQSNEGAGERLVLTTYPDQVGIKPIPLKWGAPNPEERGPILASRGGINLKKRNAIGAYSGSYSIYHALSLASGQLTSTHRPDYTNTEPPVKFGPHPQWTDGEKIVSLDPFGHQVQTVYKSYLDEGLDLRPTIAITKAHMRVPELGKGTFKVDGQVVVSEDGELVVSKAAVEPVWYLPGVASRFKISENVLRRTLL